MWFRNDPKIMSPVSLCVKVSYDKFVLCRICVVSHNWVSVPYLVNLPNCRYLADIEEWIFIKHVHQILVDVSTEYHLGVSVWRYA